MNTNVEITDDLDRLDFPATSALLKTAYWGGDRTDELHRAAFANSVCVIALIDGQQVGFARASGDRATYARISDVMIWPGYRGRGIGVRLVQALLEHPALATVSTWTLATSDAHGLYHKFGFKASDASQEMRMDRGI